MEIQLIQHTNKEMHSRLEKASHAGDVDELLRMLQEDNLLLHQLNSLYPMSSPLHIASALGHANFVKEILARRPEYAVELNAHGLTALHLACANGHLPVVRELVRRRKKFAVEICEVRDKDGFLPIHTAALRGNVQILEELLGSCSHVAVRGLTCLGDSILHLAVKSNCFEAIKILVGKVENDKEFLNLRDPKGNTILHLAIARKQLQTVKFLLGTEWTEVNAKNKKGCTAMDVLLESPSEPGDLLLGEILRAAGGAATETAQPIQSLQQTEQKVAPNKPPSTCISWKSIKRIFCGFSRKGSDKSKEDRNMLMVVNTLIATVTFQAGLNPPGGFAQIGDEGKALANTSPAKIGQAIIAHKLKDFLLYDIAALIFSLNVILLLTCGPRRHRKRIIICRIMTWMAVVFTGFAFLSAITLVFPSTKDDSSTEDEWAILVVWLFMAVNAVVCYQICRFHKFIYKNISRCIVGNKTRLDGRARCFFPFATLTLIKICMVASCLAICGAYVFWRVKSKLQ